MTMKAGPGKTSSATPISKTVAPITETITRRTTFIFSTFQMLESQFIDEGESLDCSLQTSDFIIMNRRLPLGWLARLISL
jgi:hypothetical protein